MSGANFEGCVKPEQNPTPDIAGWRAPNQPEDLPCCGYQQYRSWDGENLVHGMKTVIQPLLEDIKNGLGQKFNFRVKNQVTLNAGIYTGKRRFLDLFYEIPMLIPGQFLLKDMIATIVFKNNAGSTMEMPNQSFLTALFKENGILNNPNIGDAYEFDYDKLINISSFQTQDPSNLIDPSVCVNKVISIMDSYNTGNLIISTNNPIFLIVPKDNFTITEDHTITIELTGSYERLTV